MSKKLLKEYIESKLELFLFKWQYLNENDEGNVQVISKNEALKLIKDNKGQFFTVVFIKKNGVQRVMNARLGVKKYLRGGTLRYDPIAKGLLPVFDVKKMRYRMLNVNTIKSLKFGNNFYEVR